jgi:hypothetical protein
MTKRNGKQPLKKNGKHAKSTLPGTSPISGTPPPEETKWKPGQPSPNPKGRPRKLREFQDLIKDVMADELAVGGERITRITAAIRLGLSKNPVPFLEYAFGKMPTPTHAMDTDEWRDWLRNNGYSDSDIDSLIAEFAAHMGHRRVGERSDTDSKAETNN